MRGDGDEVGEGGTGCGVWEVRGVGGGGGERCGAREVRNGRSVGGIGDVGGEGCGRCWKCVR